MGRLNWKLTPAKLWMALAAFCLAWAKIRKGPQLPTSAALVTHALWDAKYGWQFGARTAAVTWVVYEEKTLPSAWL